MVCRCIEKFVHRTGVDDSNVTVEVKASLLEVLNQYVTSSMTLACSLASWINELHRYKTDDQSDDMVATTAVDGKAQQQECNFPGNVSFEDSTDCLDSVISSLCEIFDTPIFTFSGQF
jgi:hypothetical protein